MNIYEMYHHNNNRFGFWIVRKSWRNTMARVISIHGVLEGDKICGVPPYYSNPVVFGEFYNETDKDKCSFDNLFEIAVVSCPATSSYKLV